MVILENIDIDKAILQNIDIDKISNRFKFGISNRATRDQKLRKTQPTEKKVMKIAKFKVIYHFYCDDR